MIDFISWRLSSARRSTMSTVSPGRRLCFQGGYCHAAATAHYRGVLWLDDRGLTANGATAWLWMFCIRNQQYLENVEKHAFRERNHEGECHVGQVVRLS
ncbi:hypothetical protein [Bifidobacterium cebidarum]|uniref:hypothetical protein n=1 Tax=Bifidobacterium cebidarum TaxID=2650773 RepID=UPI001263F910|nr:hypothetical protein [Bifidobacterium cebidarum]